MATGSPREQGSRRGPESPPLRARAAPSHAGARLRGGWCRRRSAAAPLVDRRADAIPAGAPKLLRQSVTADRGVAQSERRRPPAAENRAEPLLDKSSQRRAISRSALLGCEQQAVRDVDRRLDTA